MNDTITVAIDADHSIFEDEIPGSHRGAWELKFRPMFPLAIVSKSVEHASQQFGDDTTVHRWFQRWVHERVFLRV